MFYFPRATHRFTRDLVGHVHHYVSYTPGEPPDSEVTEIDRKRGMTDEDLEEMAKNLGLSVEPELRIW